MEGGVHTIKFTTKFECDECGKWVRVEKAGLPYGWYTGINDARNFCCIRCMVDWYSRGG